MVKTMSNKAIMVTGGFDPLHMGHVELIENAAEYGDVLVIINSDEWLMRKKGYVFMPLRERIIIMSALQDVRFVFPITICAGSDKDDTAIAAIREFKPDYFANGGDRTKENVPEQAICDELEVEMLWGIGGENKPQSSSWLVNNAVEQMRQNGPDA